MGLDSLSADAQGLGRLGRGGAPGNGGGGAGLGRGEAEGGFGQAVVIPRLAAGRAHHPDQAGDQLRHPAHTGLGVNAAQGVAGGLAAHAGGGGGDIEVGGEQQGLGEAGFQRRQVQRAGRPARELRGSRGGADHHHQPVGTRLQGGGRLGLQGPAGGGGGVADPGGEGRPCGALHETHHRAFAKAASQKETQIGRFPVGGVREQRVIGGLGETDLTAGGHHRRGQRPTVGDGAGDGWQCIRGGGQVLPRMAAVGQHRVLNRRPGVEQQFHRRATRRVGAKKVGQSESLGRHAQ